MPRRFAHYHALGHLVSLVQSKKFALVIFDSDLLHTAKAGEHRDKINSSLGHDNFVHFPQIVAFLQVVEAKEPNDTAVESMFESQGTEHVAPSSFFADIKGTAMLHRQEEAAADVEDHFAEAGGIHVTNFLKKPLTAPGIVEDKDVLGVVDRGAHVVEKRVGSEKADVDILQFSLQIERGAMFLNYVQLCVVKCGSRRLETATIERANVVIIFDQHFLEDFV